MANKWEIIHDDEKAQEEERVCYYCKRFFLCQNADMLCSKRLPQWQFLSFLMRKVTPGDRCNNFVLHRVYERRVRQK